ncbi:hypothetical protein [Tritonibacter mobilis]|uniref:hypothetical protein n=1 Tax=Tritonibacter mobilis TaxID=379347 RepID=UPI003A5BBC91
MRGSDGFAPGLSGFGLIALTYIVCHGVTIWVIAPAQRFFLDDVSVIASLAYLPHGVRVLSIWLVGWRAILPLIAGAVAANMIFTSSHIVDLMQGKMSVSILMSVLSAYAAFEVLRLLGVASYAGGGRRVNWRTLMLTGLLASVFNSVCQTLIFSGIIAPDGTLWELASFVVGDMIGQIVLMIALMMIFRALRGPATRA